MGFLKTSFLLPLVVTLASADSSCLSAVTWGIPRIDLFGVVPEKSIWHRFYTGYDWQPEGFEQIAAEGATCPSLSSWEYGRFDIVWANDSSWNVMHKYYARGNWGPSWEENENLGGNVKAVNTNSWGPNRLDIVGLASNGSCMHKAWTGNGYYPGDKEWEDLGGNLASVPHVVSWGPNRLDIVGISGETRSLTHKFWDGYQWNGWEDQEGGPFIGNPTGTSWGGNRLDLWAVDEKGHLNHKYWDGHQWNGWEEMGGRFSETPQVVHWAPGRIDIVGKNVDNNKYYLKSYDGFNWNPHIKGWYELSGPYKSEPRLLRKVEGLNFLYLFGIDAHDIVRMQIWNGNDWQPSPQDAWPLGDLSSPYADKDSTTAQIVFGNEL
ncbi:hypothetical protein GGS21DRAFT_244866 [Xylaria nigripes]|nr:hypothetical protein GGS21DRAFT_244866 [Xylaria nigripes]